MLLLVVNVGSGTGDCEQRHWQCVSQCAQCLVFSSDWPTTLEWSTGHFLSDQTIFIFILVQIQSIDEADSKPTLPWYTQNASEKKWQNILVHLHQIFQVQNVLWKRWTLISDWLLPYRVIPQKLHNSKVHLLQYCSEWLHYYYLRCCRYWATQSVCCHSLTNALTLCSILTNLKGVSINFYFSTSTMNILDISLKNLPTNNSFENLRLCWFQNCPRFWKLMKKYQSYAWLKKTTQIENICNFHNHYC